MLTKHFLLNILLGIIYFCINAKFHSKKPKIISQVSQRNNYEEQHSKHQTIRINRKDENHKIISQKPDLLTKQILALKTMMKSLRSWEPKSYEEMTWLLHFFNHSCEPYAHLYSIGSSVQNRELWVLAISDNPSEHEIVEPEVKIVANVHGNENVGREVILHMIDHICTNIDSDISLRKLFSSIRVHFLPSLNPDGFEMARSHKHEKKNVGRLNANGVDLNRNFPDQFFPSFHDPEPEALAVMKWMENIPFVLSLSLHDGAFVVTYPFDDSPSGQTKYSATPDDDIFRYFSRLYAETHPEMHLSNMGNCSRFSQHKRFIGGITNGAEWSSLTNTMQDYNYVQSNCFEITVEMSCVDELNSSNIPKLFKQNYPSIISFIRQALRGIKGIVKDTEGNPIEDVHISISDRKHDVKTAKDGDYWRPVLPGTYEVTARHRNFETSTTIITVENTVATWVNFTLSKAVTDPNIAALGHLQKSINLLTFEIDGRESPDSEDKEEEINSKGPISNNEEMFDGRDRDFSTEKKFNEHSDFRNKINPSFTLPSIEMDTNNNDIQKTSEVKQTNSNKNKFFVNDFVSCSIPGRTHPLQGNIKWQGNIPELANHTSPKVPVVILGLDLTDPDDLATDGTFLGKRYFFTKQNHAYFVPINLCEKNNTPK